MRGQIVRVQTEFLVKDGLRQRPVWIAPVQRVPQEGWLDVPIAVMEGLPLVGRPPQRLVLLATLVTIDVVRPVHLSVRRRLDTLRTD